MELNFKPFENIQNFGFHNQVSLPMLYNYTTSRLAFGYDKQITQKLVFPHCTPEANTFISPSHQVDNKHAQGADIACY